MKNPTPQPVVVTTVCSLCGEGWELHGDNPTTLDCIRLLKARIPTVTITRPYVVPAYPYTPWWYQSGTTYTVDCGTTTSASSVQAINATSTVTYNMPDEGEPPQPVAA